MITDSTVVNKEKVKENGNSKDNGGGGNNKEATSTGITDSLKELFEIQRIRNRFINHEFKKLDRSTGKLSYQPKTSNSDTESESDSEHFLNKTSSSTSASSGKHHQHHQRVATSNGAASTQQQQPSQQPQQKGTSSSSSSTSSTPSTTSTTTSQGKRQSFSSISPNTTISTSELNLFVSRSSLLSSDTLGTSYKGFLNLMVLLLILSSFRLVILNHLTYGIRIDLSLLAVSEWHRWPGLMIGLAINIFIIGGYLIERSAAWNLLPKNVIKYLRILNCSSSIVVPSASIILFSPNPASSIVVMIIVCVVSMKMISYHYENSKQRKLNPDNSKYTKEKDQTIYPNNLSLKNTYWFMLVPTLCYQLSYPRSQTIRKGYLARRIFEAVFLSALIFWLVEQYMVPLVENSVVPMEQFDTVRILERVLKLSLPNLYVWLLGFYVFFHLYLNICAEITRFGDREFYRDWWNATSIAYFWQSWNIPVHHFMIVHIYTPMRRRGWSKNMGYFMCFFISAVFHELVISIPFRTIKLWAFFGMMSQIVLIVLTRNLFQGTNFGNVIFWVSILLGQPFLVLQYYISIIQENPHLYPKEIHQIHDYNQ